MVEENMMSEKPKSNVGMIVLLVILVAIIFGGIGYWYAAKKANDKKTAAALATVTSTSTATTIASKTASTTAGSQVSVSEINQIVKNYYDWILAKQSAGENYLDTKSYLTADFLTTKYANSVEGLRASNNYNPMLGAVDKDKITKYVIDNSYGSSDKATSNTTASNGDDDWAIVFELVKENGVWKIDSVGTAG